MTEINKCNKLNAKNVCINLFKLNAKGFLESSCEHLNFLEIQVLISVNRDIQKAYPQTQKITLKNTHSTP